MSNGKQFKIGSKVKITGCMVNPAMVGKTGTIVKDASIYDVPAGGPGGEVFPFYGYQVLMESGELNTVHPVHMEIQAKTYKDYKDEIIGAYLVVVEKGELDTGCAALAESGAIAKLVQYIIDETRKEVNTNV